MPGLTEQGEAVPSNRLHPPSPIRPPHPHTHTPHHSLHCPAGDRQWRRRWDGGPAAELCAPGELPPRARSPLINGAERRQSAGATTIRTISCLFIFTPASPARWSHSERPQPSSFNLPPSQPHLRRAHRFRCKMCFKKKKKKTHQKTTTTTLLLSLFLFSFLLDKQLLTQSRKDADVGHKRHRDRKGKNKTKQNLNKKR